MPRYPRAFPGLSLRAEAAGKVKQAAWQSHFREAGRSWAIGVPSQLSSPSTGVPSPLDGEG
jgi:hypothetical protein